jgi:hypothetical protein
MYLPNGAMAAAQAQVQAGGAAAGAPYTLRLINPPLAEQPLTLGMRVLKVIPFFHTLIFLSLSCIDIISCHYDNICGIGIK